jgi:hypothetical protein
VVGLHLERVGKTLRLFDPAAGQLLETPAERVRHAESRAEQAETRAERAEGENERLRRELEALRRRSGGKNGTSI